VRTALKVIASVVAGVITFYVILAALAPTQSTHYWWLFSSYKDVFGFAPFMGHLVETAPWSDYDEFYGPSGRETANAVTIGFWTPVFGALYFVFVFRRRKTI
jgi:hypothetical protein